MKMVWRGLNTSQGALEACESYSNQDQEEGHAFN